MNDAWRTWLSSGRLTGEGVPLGRSGDASSVPVVEYGLFGATDRDIDQEGVVMDILDHVFDRTHGGGCQCMHLRAAAFLVPEAEDQLSATVAFWHSRPKCPAQSDDEWLAVQQVARTQQVTGTPSSHAP